MLKQYNVYMDDGKNVFKCLIPAEDEKAAADYANGNGEVVAVRKAITHKIDVNFLADTLAANGFEQKDIDIITRTLCAVNFDA